MLDLNLSGGRLICWLIKRKVRIHTPSQASNRIMKRIRFFRRFPQQILAKTRRVNKPAMKKSSLVDDKLQFTLLAYKINVHNLSSVRSWAIILTRGLLLANYVCILYVTRKISAARVVNRPQTDLLCEKDEYYV